MLTFSCQLVTEEIKSVEHKILIIDDNLETVGGLVSELENTKNFTVIKTCQTADEGLEIAKNISPDVIVTDIILKGMDGFEFLENLQNMGSKAKIIILSALSQENFVTKAISMGASYYMIKPCKNDVLLKRINDVLEDKASTEPHMLQDKKQMRALEEKITNIFITVGIPAHIKGYQFLREAIKMAIDNPEIINSITKKLYPSIAQKFETSPSKVERAIRHAIEVAWNRGKIENINTLFGVKVYSNNEKPTNGEFIALVADKMLLEGI